MHLSPLSLQRQNHCTHKRPHMEIQILVWNQAQKCVHVEMVNGIPTFPLFMIISNDNSIKGKQTIRNLDRFSQPLKKD